MPDERDRIITLEAKHESTVAELKRIQADTEKHENYLIKRQEKTEETFRTIGTTLVKMSEMMETQRVTISDLKDVTKDLSNTQNKMLGQMNAIDAQNRTMQAIQADVAELKTKVSTLEKIEAKLSGSWKAIVGIASIVSFVISISFSAWKLVSTPPPPPKVPTAVELQVDRMIQQQQINSLRSGK